MRADRQGSGLADQMILDTGSVNSFSVPINSPWLQNRTLINRGTFNRADSTGTITLSNAAEIINEGVWNGGASNWIATGSGAGIKRFTNAVGAQYNHASGNSYLAVEVINNGTLAVAGGILQLGGGGTLAGAQTLSAGGTLEVQNAAINVSSGATFTGAGVLRIIGGALTFNGPVSVPNLAIGGGVVNGSGTPTITGGLNWYASAIVQGSGLADQMILDTGSVNSFSVPINSPWLQNRTLINRGTMTRSNSTATLSLANAAEIVNEGIWNGGSSNWIATGSGAGIKRFTNAVGAQYNHASGNSYLAVEVINNGTLAVAGGILQLGGGGTLAGAQTLSAGGTLEVQTAAFNVSSGATFTGAGVLRIIGGALTFNGPVSVPNLAIGGGVVNGSGTPTITGGLNWYASAIVQGSGLADQMILDTGSVNSFSVPINSPWLQNRTLINRGTMNQQSSTVSLVFAGAAEIVNEGVWNLDSNTALVVGAGAGSKRFRNEAGATLSKVGGGTASIGPDLTNAGTLQVTVDTTLNVNTFTQSAGTTALASLGFLQQLSTPLAFQGGHLRGVGTVQGSVNNTGATVAPGSSPGTLTITGSYTQSAAGALEIELAGAAAGSSTSSPSPARRTWAGR
ncbi:MAG: hypothetical protein IPH76_08045 [Xanthomonadales bacterium]|nr:hypothetical protein [Xanthomonadales bacterium]